MPLYLPDSTVLIGYGRGRREETEWFQRVLNGQDVVGSCAVTISECVGGARPRERAGWREVFDSFTYWDIEPGDAAQSGTYRYDFAREGFQLKLGDTLIAAVARRVGAIVVTDNLRDFPMSDIQVIPLPMS